MENNTVKKKKIKKIMTLLIKILPSQQRKFTKTTAGVLSENLSENENV